MKHWSDVCNAGQRCRPFTVTLFRTIQSGKRSRSDQSFVMECEWSAVLQWSNVCNAGQRWSSLHANFDGRGPPTLVFDPSCVISSNDHNLGKRSCCIRTCVIQRERFNAVDCASLVGCGNAGQRCSFIFRFAEQSYPGKRSQPARRLQSSLNVVNCSSLVGRLRCSLEHPTKPPYPIPFFLLNLS